MAAVSLPASTDALVKWKGMIWMNGRYWKLQHNEDMHSTLPNETNGECVSFILGIRPLILEMGALRLTTLITGSCPSGGPSTQASPWALVPVTAVGSLHHLGESTWGGGDEVQGFTPGPLTNWGAALFGTSDSRRNSDDENFRNFYKSIRDLESTAGVFQGKCTWHLRLLVEECRRLMVRRSSCL